MINANDLRIGNWVLAPKAIAVVSCPTSECNDLIDYRIVFIGENFSHGDWFSPIPLTPEILLACGFHKHNNAWVLDDYSETDYNKDFFSIWNQHDGEYSLNTTQFPISLTSLHQLQNIYFALTGEELNYSPGEQK